MNKQSKIGTLVALVLVGVVVWYIAKANTSNITTPSNQNPTSTTSDTSITTPEASQKINNDETKDSSNTTIPESSTQPAADSVTAQTSTTVIAYTNGAFNPLSVSISVGEKVTFINNDPSRSVNLSSDPHPIHTDYLPLNAGIVNPSKSASVTFTKAGTFGFHNHTAPSETGTVSVK